MPGTTEHIVKLRRGLIHNGYRVVPCAGKRAQGLNWQNGRWSADQMVGLLRHLPHATNTGIITGDVVAIDVDTPNEGVARDINAMVADLPHADAAPYRIGRAPKRLYLFRAATPRSKMATGAYLIDGAKHQVEVLGTGNQFVAYGIHPDTGRAYEWHNGSPAETPFADLPLADPEDVDTLLTRAEAYFAERGTLLKKPSTSIHREARPISSDHPWVELNQRALTRLGEWVPHLGLEGLRRYRNGYHSVASFRPTNSATARHRGRALNIQPEGICDHADNNRGYSPIDLVGVCLNLQPTDAVDWLKARVGVEPTTVRFNIAAMIANDRAKRAAKHKSF